MNYRRLKLQLFSLLSAIALFAVISCEIGLGSAVDVAVPTSSISYPPKNAIIRDSFVAAGECDDDMGVVAVKVTVYNPENEKEYGPYDAVIDEKGKKWSITLNQKDASKSVSVFDSYKQWEFPDGNYIINAVAYDGQEKQSAIASCPVSIDNTAPVFIVSKPLAIGANVAATVYGCSLKISGDIAEDHDTSKLVLYYRQYSETTGDFTSPLKSIEIENSEELNAVSSSNPLILARFGKTQAAAATELHRKYLEIYDASSSEETQYYYGGFMLEDNAKLYVTPGDNGSGTGNQTSQYYLLGNDFQNTLAVQYSLTAQRIMQIIKGQSDDYSEAEISDITGILSKADTTGINYASSTALTDTANDAEAKAKSSKFSLNPDNSPTWSLDEYGVTSTTLPGQIKGYTAGSSLILSLRAGRDASFPDPKTVSVDLYELGQANDTDNYYNASLTGLTPIHLLDRTGENAPKWNESADDSHKSYIFTLDTETYGLKSNYIYRMVVSGTDRNGTSLEEANDNNYLLKLTTSNNIPKVTITSPANDYVYGVENTVRAGNVNVNGVTIEGYVIVDGVSLKSIADHGVIVKEIKIAKVSDNSQVAVTGLVPTVTSLTQSTEDTNKYLFTITVVPGSGSSFVPSAQNKYLVTVTVQAEDIGNLQGEKSVKFYIDNKQPEVHVTSVSPSVAGASAGTEYVNGKIVIAGNASDSGNTGSGLKSLTYEIKKGTGDEAVVKASGNLASTTPIPEVWTIPTFDTTICDAEDDNENTVNEITAYVTATDEVDNKKTETRTIYVKQSTDRPTLTLSNANKDIDTDVVNSTTGLWKNRNMFATTGTNKLLGLLRDDDGLATVNVTVKQGDTQIATKQYNAEGNKEYNLDFTLQKSDTEVIPEGKYQVIINAADNKNETSYSTLEESFYIAIDNGAPAFGAVNVTPVLTGTDYYQGNKESETTKTLSVSGTLTDGNGITSLTRSDGTVITLTGDNPKSKNFADTITLENASGTYRVTYTAKDIFDKESTYTVEYSVDVDDPVISNVKIDNIDVASNSLGNHWIKDNNVDVSVSVTDIVNDASNNPIAAHSGIKEVTYSIAGGAQNRQMSHSASEDATDGSGTEKWNASVSFPDGDAGQIEIKVTDNVGNVKTQTINVKVDKTKPTLSALWYKVADSADSATAGTLTAFSGTIPTTYVNSTNIVIFGNYTDISSSYAAGESCSGVQELEFKIGDQDVLEQITYYKEAFEGTSSIDNTIVASNVVDLTTGTAEQKKEKSKLIKSYIAVIDHTKFADGEIIAYAKDNANNTISGNTTDGSALRIMNLVTDSERPAIDAGRIKIDNSYKSSNNKFYLSRTITSDKLTVRGTSTDNYGVDKTTIEITGTSSANPSVTYTYTSEQVSTGSWSFANIDLTLWKKSTAAELAANPTAVDTLTIKLNAYDKAGNYIAAANQPVITLVFDESAPAVLTGGTNGSDPADTSNPFLEEGYNLRGAPVYKYGGIKIGTGENGTYSDSSYGRENSVQIQMTFVGEKAAGAPNTINYFGSGVSEIEYVMFSSTQAASFSGITTGKYIVDSEHPDPTTEAYTSRGKFDITEGNYTHHNSTTEIPCTFGTYTIGGFESTVGTNASPNLLFVRAKDNCGNVSANEWFVLLIQLDQTVPAVTKADGTPLSVLTNGRSDVQTLTGTVTDNGAGLKALKVYVDGVEAFSVGGQGNHNATETVNNTYGSFTYTFEGTNSFADAAASVNWSLTLKPYNQTTNAEQTWFTNLLNKPSPQITIEAEDWAEDSSGSGNKGTGLITSLDLDTTAPTATITTPDSSEDINGLHTIEGSVEEDHTPRSVGIYYSTKSTAPTAILADEQAINADPVDNWKLLKKFTTDSGTDVTDSEDAVIIDYNVLARDLYRVTFDKDFNSLIASSAESGDVHILLYAQDEAGNVSDISDYETFTVDKNSDRPIITVTNIDLIQGNSATAADNALSATNYLKHNTSTVNFKVTDDDGAVQQVKYRIIKLVTTTNDAGQTVTTPAIVKDWTPITLATGDTSITFENNGKQILEFYVKDKDGTEFWSEPAASLGTLHKIYLKDTASTVHTYGGTDSGFENPKIYINVDTNPPVVNILGIQRLDASKVVKERNDEGNVDGTVWKEPESFSSLAPLGGPEAKYLKVKVSATDDGSGVNEVTFTATLDGTAVTVEDVDSTNQPALDGYYYYYVPCFKAGQTEKDSKNLVLTVEAEDNVEKTASDTLTFKVDDKNPVISITAPSATETLSGSVTAEGAIDNRESTTLYYAISPIYSDPTNAATYVSPESYTNSTVFSYSRTDKNGVTTSVNIPAANHLESICNYKPMSRDPAVNNPAMSFYLWLDGKTDGSASGIHTNTLNDWIINMGITTAAELSSTTNPYEYIIQLYFYVKAVDSAGNVTEKVHPILLDPLGNRPQVIIGYPSANGEKLGGMPTIMGTASGTNGVDYVWLQIDTDADGDWDYDDFTKLYGLEDSEHINKLYTLGNMKTKQAVTSINESSVTASNVAEYAIMIPLSGSSSSWNQEINKGEELYEYIDSDTETQSVTIWAYATDTQGFPSVRVVRTLEMDKDSPLIDQNIWLVQWASGKNGSNGFSVDESGNVTIPASSYTKLRAYEEGASITGRWYIVGKVSDGTGISSISYRVKNTSVTTTNYDTVNAVTTLGADFANTDTNNPGTYLTHITGNNYVFCLPVGVAKENEDGSENEDVGEFSVEFSAEENSNSHRSVNKTFKVRYDNKKPVIETKLVDVDTTTVTTTNPLIVVNSDGSYSFSGITSESNVGNIEQTGVERIVFYFTRNITDNPANPTAANTKVFDPMMRSKVNGTPVTGNALTCSDLSPEDGMYWKSASASVTGSTVTIGASDPNVHKGGLVKVNDVIYRIDSMSGTTLNLNDTTGISSATNTTVKFAIANVIDNPTRETPGTTAITANYGWGYHSDVDFDDGDLMVESLIPVNKIYTWSASINSRNISDGPVTLNYLVMDKAGNASAVQKIECFIQNNVPRIAGVQLGTDENGNGEVDDSEIETEAYSEKYAYGYNGETKVRSLTVPFNFDLADNENNKAVFAIKGKTLIKPEVIGGNGTVNYKYTVAEPKTDNTGWNNAYYTSSSGVFGIGTEDDDAHYINSSGIVISIVDCLTTSATNLYGIKDGENQKFTFTFSDSTPGLNGTTESQKAELEIIMDVALRDENPANNKIIPFYWKGIENNSILWKLDEDSNPVYETGYELGHIELSKDLKDIKEADGVTQKFKETGGTGVYTLNPKVSGAVKLEGIAKDDSLLSSLGISISAYNGGNEITMATFNAATGAWSGTAAITQATYGELIAAGYITAAQKPANKKLTDKAPYISQAYGHVVHWTYEINTETMNLGPAAGIQISVSAKDRGKPTPDDGETLGYKYTSNNFRFNGPAGTTLASVGQSGGYYGASAYTCKYIIDVVPYIRGIKTKLSTKSSKEDTSEIDRTALGHYPAATTETIYFYGFNLKQGGVISDSATPTVNTLYLGAANTTAFAGYTVYPTTSDAAGTTATSISSLKSGKLSLTVGGIPALNNENNNDAKGDYSKAKPGIDDYDDEETYTTFSNFYNRKPNDTSNYAQTDDVVLDVWKLNDRAAKPAASGAIVDPVMKINPDSGIIGFAYVSGTRRFSMANKNNSYQLWVGDYDNLSATGFAYDSAGNTYGTALGGDINSSFSNSKFAFMSSLWGPSDTGNVGTKSDKKHQRIEQIGQLGTKTTGGNTKYIDKSRVLSPSIAVSGSGTSATVYLAYFDHLNKEIRFRWAANPKNDTGNNKTRGFNGTSYINDNYKQNNLGSNGNWNNNEAYPLDKYNIADFQIIAETGITNTNSLGDAGSYVSIAVLPDAGGTGDAKYDVVVLAWYDEEAKNLMYTYNTKDIKANGNFTFGTATTKNLWRKAVKIFTKAGMYCQIMADAKGGIHFAGYDGDAGILRYAKIDSYVLENDSDYDEDTMSCIVDANGIVGSDLTLDVALESDAADAVAVPYIGYYGTARPKMAFLSEEGIKALKAGDNISSVKGSISGKYTGYWEATELPTDSKSVKDRVNVGVWKTVGGVIKNSIYDLTTHNNDGATSNDGKTYGNGTKNPVVAYEIRPSTDEGYMETAQKQ